MWIKQRIETISTWRQTHHCIEGYRWGRMALYLDFGRTAPEYLEDERIDEIINEAWNRNPPLFKMDR
jgi:hypothetical protein